LTVGRSRRTTGHSVVLAVRALTLQAVGPRDEVIRSAGGALGSTRTRRALAWTLDAVVVGILVVAVETGSARAASRVTRATTFAVCALPVGGSPALPRGVLPALAGPAGLAGVARQKVLGRAFAFRATARRAVRTLGASVDTVKTNVVRVALAAVWVGVLPVGTGRAL